MLIKTNDSVHIKIEKVGDFYRKKDFIIEHEGKHYIISQRDLYIKGGVDVIECLPNGQRLEKPKRVNDILHVLTSILKLSIRKTEIFFNYPNGQVFQIV